jgi:hypothetical protein
MKPLTQYGLMAEKHWRQFLPRMTAHLEATGQLLSLLLASQERTEAEMDNLCRRFRRQGLTAEQAHERAWEMVRERYIFLPPES